MRDQCPIDLFQTPDAMPNDLRSLMDRMSDEIEHNDPNEVCRNYLPVVERMGYTFEWGLDGIPYELRPSDKNTDPVVFKEQGKWVYVKTEDTAGQSHRFLVREATVAKNGDLTLQFFQNGNPNRPIWRTYPESRLSILNISLIPERSPRLREVLDMKPHMSEVTIPDIKAEPVPTLDLGDDEPDESFAPR